MPTPVRAAGAIVIGAAIFACSWVYRFNDPGGSFAFLTDDHFFYLVRGWQILFGDLPVRDFVDHGAPLFYYVGAAVQVLFGRGTLSEIVFCVTLLSAGAVGVFLLAARASGSLLLGLAAAAFHVLLEPRFYNYPKILVYVAAIPALWACADRPDRLRVALLAIVTVVGFLFRHDHGLFIAATFAILLWLLRAVPWQQRLRTGVLYAALVVALLAPYLLFIQLNGGLVSYVRTAVAWAERDRDRAEFEWPAFDNPDGVSPGAEADAAVTRMVARIRDNGVAWVFYAELALPIVSALMLVLSPTAFRPAWAQAAAKLGAVAALAAMLDAGFLRSPLAARLADPSVPHAVLAAWLPVALAGLLARRDALRPPLRHAAARVAIAAAAFAFIVPLLAVLAIAVTDDLGRRIEKARLSRGVDEGLEWTEFMWQRIGDAFPLRADPALEPDELTTLALYVRACTRPTDRVFMQHYLPQVLALGERGFAGGHADLRPGFFTTPEMQHLTVQRLRRQSVPVALVGGGDVLGGFRSSFPIVVRYFDEHYRSAGEREFDGRFSVQLLVRRDAEPLGRFEPLDWPCYR
jgi:hypothetical protein